MNPIADFLATLTSARTVERYRAALEEFTAWYQQTNGAEPDWQLLTSVEVKDYITYLQRVRRLSPASVNLRLAARCKPGCRMSSCPAASGRASKRWTG